MMEWVAGIGGTRHGLRVELGSPWTLLFVVKCSCIFVGTWNYHLDCWDVVFSVLSRECWASR